MKQFSDLLQEAPSQVEKWINSQEIKMEPQGFNWVTLAQGAMTNASFELNTGVPSSIDWARIVVIIYESMLESDPWLPRHSILTSMMHLRVSMIRHFGAVSGDKVLDVNSIVQWFYSEWKLSYDETSELAASWRSLPHPEIISLRELRDRIDIIKHLYDSGSLNLDDDLKRWVALRPLLP